VLRCWACLMDRREVGARVGRKKRRGQPERRAYGRDRDVISGSRRVTSLCSEICSKTQEHYSRTIIKFGMYRYISIFRCYCKQ